MKKYLLTIFSVFYFYVGIEFVYVFFVFNLYESFLKVPALAKIIWLTIMIISIVIYMHYSKLLIKRLVQEYSDKVKGK